MSQTLLLRNPLREVSFLACRKKGVQGGGKRRSGGLGVGIVLLSGSGRNGLLAQL